MLENQVVVVTGSARGIGRYIAHTFAKEGAHLAVADIEPLDKVAGELKEMEADVLAVSADVTNEEQVRSLMRQVAEHYGRIDVLVNNAGIVPHFAWGVPRWAPIRELDKAFWDKVINTNLGGTMPSSTSTAAAVGSARRPTSCPKTPSRPSRASLRTRSGTPTSASSACRPAGRSPTRWRPKRRDSASRGRIWPAIASSWRPKWGWRCPGTSST